MDPTIIKNFIFKPLSLGSLIWAFFYAFESIGKSMPEGRFNELADRLNSFNPTNLILKVSNALSDSFERIFGDKYFSGKAFKKTTVFSFISVVILYFIALALKEISWESLIWKDWFFWLIYLAINFVIFNLIPDYIIYAKTRYVLHILAGGKHKYTKVLIIDVLVTLVFGIIKYLIINYVLTRIFGLGDNEQVFISLWDVLKLSISNFEGTEITYLNAVPGVFLYSGLFFSIFPWFYLLSSYLASKSRKISQFSTFIKKWIDVENKPIESLRTISIVLITLVGLIVFIGNIIL